MDRTVLMRRKFENRSLLTFMVSLLEVSGLLLSTGFPLLLVRHSVNFRNISTWEFLGILSLSYIMALLITRTLNRFPRSDEAIIILGNTSLSFLIGIAIIALTRTYYSRTVLITSFLLTFTWLTLLARFLKRSNLKIGVLSITDITDKLKGLFKVDSKLRAEVLSIRSVKDLDEDNPDILIIPQSEQVDRETLELISEAKLRHIPTLTLSEMYELLLGRINIDEVEPRELIKLAPQTTWYVLWGKRLLDILIVLLSLPIVIPLCVLISIGIYIESGSPVLFWQTRVGQGGKTFEMVKFRTMRYVKSSTEPSFTTQNDPRITKLGKFLRKYRLDELPQLWNVLRGDMSLIGPRPEQVKFVEEYKASIPAYNCRHLVKPGITGWAQINLGYTSDLESTKVKLGYDLYYVKHICLWLDLLIIFKTLEVILTGYGAR